MRTFAQKPKITLQTTPAKSTIPSRAFFGQSRELRSILHLQRTIGNQAVRQLLQIEGEERKDSSLTSTSPRFAHDFSRIPLHAKARAEIQPKLTVNSPADRYEQEADRVSEQVMRKQNFEPVKSYESKLQRKESGDVVNSFAPKIVRDVLSSGGRPLGADTRAFMESRFRLNFGNVKIHDNNVAAQSANSINALAYTSGNNIVFNNGQYAPDTQNGKKLLAHELVHVRQQGDGNATNSVQRFSDPDHHIVEEVALGSLFTEDELKSIEQGNMQRDYSQVSAGANAVLLGTNIKTPFT